MVNPPTRTTAHDPSIDISSTFPRTITLPAIPPTTVPNCSAAPIDWVLYIGALLILCLGWWVLEIPLLFTKSSYQPLSSRGADEQLAQRKPLGRFWDAVRWNCCRTLTPTAIGVIAIARNLHEKAWPGLYYFGAERTSTSRAGFTLWQWVKILLTDVVPIVFFCLLIWRSPHMMNTWNILFPAWWLVAYTVQCVLGLYLLAASNMPNPPRAGWTIIIGFPVMLFTGVVFCVPAFLVLKKGGMPPQLGWSVFLTWYWVLIPFTLWGCCGGRGHLLVYIMNASFRMIPLLIGMFDNRPLFIFCSFNYTGVTVVVGILGGALPLILGMWGQSALCERYRPDLRRISEGKYAGQTAQELTQELSQ